MALWELTKVPLYRLQKDEIIIGYFDFIKLNFCDSQYSKPVSLLLLYKPSRKIGTAELFE